jgi:hypothetical protein
MPTSDWLTQGFMDFFNKSQRIASVSCAAEKVQVNFFKKSIEIRSRMFLDQGV